MATYGVEGVGTHPPWSAPSEPWVQMLQHLTKQGRCPINSTAIAEGPRWDPYVMGPANTIMEM
eukprot:3717654-Karenia_brevis.AAC.1